MNSNTIQILFLFGAIFAPLFSFCILGVHSLFSSKNHERFISGVARASFVLSIGMLLGFFIILALGQKSIPEISFSWFHFNRRHFDISFATTRLTLVFLALTTTIGALVSVFSETYLHKEKGYERFYLLILLATFGMNLVVTASNLGVMVIGWEFLGISSTLLIAFYYTRNGPIKNAFRAFLAYRLADFGFLLALIYGHHVFGTADLTKILNAYQGPFSTTVMGTHYFVFGALLFFAAVGKSSLLPFFPWLPRSMEGPTPSSALFYGGFTVHAGTFLILRCAPIITVSASLSMLLIVVGMLSAFFSTFLGRIRSDIKTSLAYASMTQVSFIYIEIGLHWYYLAAFHIAGHMCLRTYQFLRAPSALHDLHVQETLGVDVRELGRVHDRFLPRVWQHWLYRLSFEECGVATLYYQYIAEPFLAVCMWLSRFEHRSERLLERLLERMIRAI